jgi:hypothetical protein
LQTGKGKNHSVVLLFIIIMPQSGNYEHNNGRFIHDVPDAVLLVKLPGPYPLQKLQLFGMPGSGVWMFPQFVQQFFQLLEKLWRRLSHHQHMLYSFF